MTLAMVRDEPEPSALDRFEEMRNRLAPALQAMVDVQCIINDVRPAERIILNCLLDGLEYVEIAKKLGLSVHTVKNQSNRLYSRFGLNRREDLFARIFRRKASS